MESNSDVINAWYAGHKAEARNLSTDGVDLYSYALLIAKGSQVLDYTKTGLGFISQTTSQHVGMAKRKIGI